MPFMYRRIPQEQPTPGEWQTDEHGRKYREIAPGHREYEMMVATSSGLEIPESELGNFYRRQREAEEKRRQMALEEMRNKPDPKNCPFSNGMSNTCKREKCVLFHNGQCSIAIVADAHGTAHPVTQDAKCPFSIYGRCDRCALNNGGCAFVRLAAATCK